MVKGHNLRKGHPDGDKGRRLAGGVHAARNGERLDDSNRTLAQYYGQVAFWKLVQKLGSERAARDHMSSLGQKAWAKEMREFSHYLGLMREGINGKV